MFRTYIFFTLCFLIVFGTLSCQKSRDDQTLFAPLSQEDIDYIIKNCNSKKELFEQCGKPFRMEESDGIEHFEFMISFEKLHKSTSLMIASFIVTVSNDTVLSWQPHMKGRIH